MDNNDIGLLKNGMVAKPIPGHCVAVGVPARKMREGFMARFLARLRKVFYFCVMEIASTV